jgi:hypothetical protein
MNKYSIEFRRKFPAWSKIRVDESSIGSMIFSKIGESLEAVKLGKSRLETQQRILENEQLLEVSDYYEAVFTGDQLNQLQNIQSTVSPAIDNLTRLDLLEDYYSKLPNELELVSTKTIQLNLDYSSGSVVLEEPSYLYLNISNVVFETNNYNSSNAPYVKIRGYDFTGEPREESFEVKDSGILKTKYKYRKLEALNGSNTINGGVAVEKFGFSGIVDILTRNIDLEEIEIDYHIAGTARDDVNFGNAVNYNKLIVSLRKEGGISYLDYMIRAYENGQEYKTAISNIEEEDAYYILFSQALRDASGEDLDIQSITYSKVYDRLLALDSNQNLHFFQLKETNFARKEIQRTPEIDFNFYTDYQRVAIREEASIDIFLQRGRGTIYKVFFCRRTPSSKSDQDGGELLAEFLKEEQDGSLVWSDEFYLFDGKNLENKFLNSKSLRFNDEFTEAGQYDYYSFSFQQDTKSQAILKFSEDEIDSDQFLKLVKIELEDKNQQTIFINDYSIMCEAQLSERSIALEGLEGNYKISITGLENHLSLIQGSQEKQYRFIKDLFFYDKSNNRIITFEDYNQITVKFENTSFTFQNLSKRKNATSIDEYALKHAIVRAEKESISDFKDRLLMLLSKYSKYELYHIDDSFRYVTELKSIEVGEISFDNPISEFDLTSEYLKYKKEGTTTTTTIELKDYKFLEDFLDHLNSVGITVTLFAKLEDIKYLNTRNLRPFKLSRVESNYTLSGTSSRLPHKHIEDESIYIHGETSSSSVPSIDSLNNSQQYFLDEDSIYLAVDNLNRTLTYSYKDWPIKLIWLPIKAIEVNSIDFEALTKNNGDLSQRGAKLYNQILKKQNTYWGK